MFITAILALAGASPVGPADAAVVEQTLFARNTFGYGCYRIPALVRTTKNTLLAFAEARVSFCGDSGDIDLVVRRSTDNGRTWSPMQTVLSGTDGNPAAVATRGNPVPIVDRRTGRIVLLTTFDPGTTSRPRTPYVQYSDDDGVSWSVARSLGSAIDKPAWGWYATGPCHGIQLERGAHAGRLVAGVTFSDDSYDPDRNGAALVYSDDGGETWQLGATDLRASTAIVPQELCLFERTDGAVYAAARDTNGSEPGSRAFAVSRDGGATFEAPFAMVTDVTTPESGVQGSVLRLRAADRGDRYNRVLFASPADPTYRKKLTIWSSYDEGRTWQGTVPRQLTADRSGYSDLAELASGEIGLLYEAGEDTSAGDARDEIRFTRFVESDLGLPDPVSGTATPDLSGLDNDAYLRGGAAVTAATAGRFDDAVALDGVDDYVHLPFAESLAIGTSDFTVAAWIRYSATSGGHSIFWGYNINDHSQLWLRAEPASNRIRGLIQSGSTSAVVASTQAYNNDAWHHVALQRSGTTLSLWVDGAVVGTATAPTGSISPGRPFNFDVGRKLDGSDYFQGQLDEVRIYKRALTAAELASIRSSNSVSVPGAVLRLPFTATAPTTVDTSGAGSTAFVRGGATTTAGRYGNALALDGVDDSVQLPYHAALDVGAGEFTATAWFKYGTTTGRDTLLWAYGYGTGVAQLWLRAAPADGIIGAWAETETAHAYGTTASAYNDGAWHHLALQRTSTQLLLWVDGAQVMAVAMPAGSLTAGHGGGIQGLSVGQKPDGTDRFQGAIDEVRLYTRALTVAELDQIRLSNAALPTGLVLDLPLDAL